MRVNPNLLLAVGLTLAGCDDGPPTGSSSTDGTLVVSTATAGGDPDQDGFQLRVDDDADSIALDPTGTAEVNLTPGRHTLRLLGVADHCSVAPGASVEVDIAPQSATPVAFEVSCPLTGARVTVTTTGLDIDGNGYRVVVDGSDRGVIHANNVVTVSRLAPGSRMIALTDVASNCAVDGTTSRTLILVADEIVPIEFAVVCSAASGVIGVIVEASGTDMEGQYNAMVDRAGPFRVGPGGPIYLAAVPAGDHVVSLVAPPNCSVERDAQPATVSGGGLIRDTVEVTFSVLCRPRFGTFRITAPTFGPRPAHDYSIWICSVSVDGYGYYYYCDRPPRLLAALGPDGTLVGPLLPGLYRIELRDIPANCEPTNRGSTIIFGISAGQTSDLEFRINCSS